MSWVSKICAFQFIRFFENLFEKMEQMQISSLVWNVQCSTLYFRKLEGMTSYDKPESDKLVVGGIL